ncbi:hypothetical protein D3C72_1107930 [compost metagenome]
MTLSIRRVRQRQNRARRLPRGLAGGLTSTLMAVWGPNGSKVIVTVSPLGLIIIMGCWKL